MTPKRRCSVFSLIFIVNCISKFNLIRKERVAEINEELTRLQTQVKERVRARPLSESIKEIFKKYGATVTAVAAGVTIGGCHQFSY